MRLRSVKIPLVTAAVYLGAGIAWRGAGFPPLAFFGTLVFAVLAWLWCEYTSPQSSACHVTFLILAATLGALNMFLVADPSPWLGASGTWTGQVTALESTRFYQRVTVDVEELGYAVMHASTDATVELGNILAIKGTAVIPKQAGNPGEFDYRRFLHNRRVRWFLDVTDWYIADGGSLPTGIDQTIRQRVAQRLTELEHPELLQAFLLGERSVMTQEQLDGWEVLGVTHLMAVSGMHLGVLCIILSRILLRLPLAHGLRWGILTAGILSYVVLVGARPSSLRAWGVMVLAGAAQLRQCKTEPLHYWSIAALIFFVIRPSSWLDLGFQMSFAASGGILLYLPWIGRLPRWASVLMVSIIAQLALLPILAHNFGQIALVSPLTTLLFMPVVMLLLVVGLAWLLSAGLLNILLVPLLDALTLVLLELSAWLVPAALVLPLRRFNYVEFILWYACFLAMGLTLRQRRFVPARQTWAHWALLVAFLVVIWSLPPTWTRPLHILTVDVGQGDSLLIRTPHGQTILIDGGGQARERSTPDQNVGTTRIVPLLRRLGVNHLDLVLLTHAHEDHIQGLLPILDGLSIGMVWDSGHPHTSVSYRRYLETIRDKSIPYHMVRAGDGIVLPGGVQLDILHPDKLLSGTSSDLNNNSLVLHVQYSGRSFLFSGDLDREGQMDMLRRSIPKVDWLKVPHHGSRSAWFEPWLLRLAPSTAVISVGSSNRFGHPHPQVLAGLTAAEVEVYRTDLHGGISTYVWQGIMWSNVTKR